MKEITIKKEELIKTIKKNMKIHAREYKELHEIYTKLAISELEKLIKDIKIDSKGKSLYISLSEPQSNKDDYKIALEMLDLEVNDNVTISEKEFRQYIKDEWSWSNAFAISKASYFNS